VTAGIYAELSADGESIFLAVTGDSWELDRAAKALRKLTMLAKKTDPPTGLLEIPATYAAVVQLSFTFNNDSIGRWLPQARLREWIEAEFLRRCNPGDAHADFRPPNGLTPRPYQVDGALMIGCMGKALLFDQAGTGKSATSVLGLLERQARGTDIFPLLIVVPSWEVATVWTDHIRDWAPGWPEPVRYGGSGRTVKGRDILVTTYSTASLDAVDASGPLVRLKAKAVVADEIHLAKGNSTQRSLALRRIAKHAATFVGLTGTPVTRDSGDLFPVLEAMDHASWPAKERFVKRYCLTSKTDYDETIDGLDPLREPEFRAALQGQVRRVAKADVLDQLPPLIYSVRKVELPESWRKSYDAMEADMLAELPDGTEISVMETLAQLTRLGQLASSACDVEVTEEVDERTGELKKHYEVTLRAPSWKIDALLEVLAERKDQQLVVFANSRQLVDIAEAACAKAGYRCGLVTGTASAKDRARDIAAFQGGELNVILCTAGAGGLGITLTAASTMVFLQRPWSLAESLQCEARAYRLGSERHDVVEVIDIIAMNTVEQRVREALKGKAAQLAEMVQDPRVVRELLGGLR
jgi:SNF2 family DNA or RNA helicase